MTLEIMDRVRFLMDSGPTAALWASLSFCSTAPSTPDVSECAEGEAIVQCTYVEDLTDPACPQADESSPWMGECTWRDEGGLYGQSGWAYPVCPVNDVCVPADEVDALRDAIEDGDFSAWCHASAQDAQSTWTHISGEPGPQPCVTSSVTWGPQDEQGALSL